MAEEKVTASLIIGVPAERVFAVLADPSAHVAIDGTGWIQEAADPAPLTGTGQLFRMDMYHPKHPDGEYQVVNKVVVFDPPHAIGWMTGEQQDGGEPKFAGWIWRYDLLPLGPHETEVTLGYDWSAVPQSVREYLEFPMFGPEHLPNSLLHLAEFIGPH
ncbi:polyketide cyclase [Pseudonocardiaceae bacterium YIM PH 21723]|nr:polyketide cyclase [Pseudonocardiaceae bacterium YIM PH 21723]